MAHSRADAMSGVVTAQGRALASQGGTRQPQGGALISRRGARITRRGALGLLGAAGMAACTRIARARSPADLPGAWYDLAQRLRAALPADTDPGPALELALSRLTLAMFEAANAVRPRYASYLGITPAPADTNAQAAVNAAAQMVLLASFPAARHDIEGFYAGQSATLDAGLNMLRGTVVGEHAAGLVLARPALDPAVAVAPYRPETLPGHFIAPGLPDIAAFTPALKPWFLTRGDALRPGPPPALDSAAYAQAFAETANLGAKTSTTRTPGQTEAATFWASYSWDKALHEAAFGPSQSLSDTARFYALACMTLLDARIAMADAKLFYGTWRPVTAIRNGDRLGNPAISRIADWQPLVATPADPEYPSFHAALSAALAAVLRKAAGFTPDIRYGFTSRASTQLRRLTVAQYAQIVPDSRIWAGDHFRFSTAAGTVLGQRVAALALQNFAPRLR